MSILKLALPSLLLSPKAYEDLRFELPNVFPFEPELVLFLFSGSVGVDLESLMFVLCDSSMWRVLSVIIIALLSSNLELLV